MKDVTITDTIKYIGADDKDIDLFESQYVVPNGVSYNSYVILDEKVAVMDTVDARRGEEWLANLEQALNGREFRKQLLALTEFLVHMICVDRPSGTLDPFFRIRQHEYRLVEALPDPSGDDPRQTFMA